MRKITLAEADKAIGTFAEDMGGIYTKGSSVLRCSNLMAYKLPLEDAATQLFTDEEGFIYVVTEGKAFSFDGLGWCPEVMLGEGDIPYFVCPRDA